MKNRLLSFVLLACAACGQQQPPPAAEQPSSQPPATIEIRSDGKPLVLGGSRSDSSPAPTPKPTMTMSSVMTSNGLQPANPVQAAPVKKTVPFQGAYIEELGPCKGAPIAGFIGSGADRRPICGEDRSSKSVTGARYTTVNDINGRPRRVYTYGGNTNSNTAPVTYSRPKY